MLHKPVQLVMLQLVHIWRTGTASNSIFDFR